MEIIDTPTPLPSLFGVASMTVLDAELVEAEAGADFVAGGADSDVATWLSGARGVLVLFPGG